MPRLSPLLIVLVLFAAPVGLVQARALAADGTMAAMLAGHNVPHLSLMVAQGPRAGTERAAASDAGDGPTERCDALRAEGLRVTLADQDESAYCLVDAPDAGAR